MPSLSGVIAAALRHDDPFCKADAADAIWADWRAGRLDSEDGWVSPPAVPGRPPQPALVSPSALAQRRLGSVEGRAALVHAITHIEFNAINLALDAACRFPGLPDDYYRDWLRVASEEAGHFRLLAAHMQTLGYRYGDFPAHNGLWEMAAKTAADPLDRMALVPRLLEARGLDVTPAMQARLIAAGDAKAAAILDIVFRDEVGHVAVGNRWFRWLCSERGLDPLQAFRDRLTQFDAPRQPGELNEPARLQAGFEPAELDLIRAYSAAR